MNISHIKTMTSWLSIRSISNYYYTLHAVQFFHCPSWISFLQ